MTCSVLSHQFQSDQIPRKSAAIVTLQRELDKMVVVDGAADIVYVEVFNNWDEIDGY